MDGGAVIRFSAALFTAVAVLATTLLVSAETRAAAATESPPSLVSVWGNNGSGSGQFESPEGLGVDASGNVYVADTHNDRIQKFTSDGTYLTQWGSHGTANGQFAQPVGIAADTSGNVYVVDQDNNRIQKFTSDGTYLTQWGSFGTGNGQFSFPRGAAVDSLGNVYVVDNSNHRIQKFSSDGTYLTQWGGFHAPTGIAVDSDGSVYVLDTGNLSVKKYTSSGTYVTQWGSGGTASGRFDQPFGIAVDSVGDVYVADTRNNRVQKFSPDGTYLTQWQTLSNMGVAAARFGNTYVVGTNNQVERYNRDVTDPTVALSAPSEDAVFARNQVVAADYSCADEAGGSEVDTCVGTVVDGSPIDTSTLGDHDFTVTATDNADNTTEITYNYTVEDVTDPTVDLATPSHEANIAQGQAVTADYSCGDEAGGSGLASCAGTIPDGALIDTSDLGDFAFSVTATDNADNTTEVIHSYTVVDATDPTVVIATPAAGAIVARNATVAAHFSCSDQPGGTGIATCNGTTANGDTINTSTVGDHDFTVTATDVAGNITEVTHTYTVANARPDARIRHGSGRLVGNNTYNTTGTHQTRTASAARGRSVTYYASIQNDAAFTERLRLRGQPSSPHFTVVYRSPAGTNITSQVTSGTYTTPNLAPGGTHRITITVTVKTTAPHNASLARSVTATSTTHPTIRDTVRFITSQL